MTMRRVLTVILSLALADRVYDIVRYPPQSVAQVLEFVLIIVVLTLGLWANITRVNERFTAPTAERVRNLAVIVISGVLLYTGVMIGHDRPTGGLSWFSVVALAATAAVLLWSVWRLQWTSGSATRR